MAESLRVLIVDDEPGMRLGAARALSGFTVSLPEFNGDVVFSVELAGTGAHDVLGVREPEGHEQQPGLVHVPVVAVDDGDRRHPLVVLAPQPVRRDRPASAAPENHDAMSHGTNVRGERARGQGPTSRPFGPSAQWPGWLAYPAPCLALYRFARRRNGSQERHEGSALLGAEGAHAFGDGRPVHGVGPLVSVPSGAGRDQDDRSPVLGVGPAPDQTALLHT